MKNEWLEHLKPFLLRLEGVLIWGVVAMLYITLTLLAGYALAEPRTAPKRVVVYSISQMPVEPAPELRQRTEVVYLDAILDIEATLETGLELVVPEVRVQTARERLTPKMRDDLTRAWQGLARVQRGEIAHLPAIVFDQRAVWYGANFRRALTAYRNWEKQR